MRIESKTFFYELTEVSLFLVILTISYIKCQMKLSKYRN